MLVDLTRQLQDSIWNGTQPSQLTRKRSGVPLILQHYIIRGPGTKCAICLDVQMDFKAVVIITNEEVIQNRNPFSMELRTIDSKSHKRNGKELADDP